MKRIIYLLVISFLICEVSFAWSISERFKKSIVLIENPKDDKHGTGFILKKGNRYFLVSCKHVIEGTDTVLVKFAEETEAKEVRISANGIPLFLKKGDQITWRAHPNEDVDIVAIPMLPENFGGDAEFEAIRFEFLLTDSAISSLGVNEGDEILLIGFSFMSGGNLPTYHVARRGLLSLLTKDKIHFSVDEKIYHENIYLIDVNLFPGDSGGPVFVKHNQELYVLGIAFVLWTCLGPGQLVIPPDTVNVEQTQYIDLGLVFPAQRIREIIDTFQSEDSGR